jgi:Na+-driven multidrug efflux pump
VGGIGQGFQPVCGFNYGAKRYDRLFRAFRFALICMTVPLVFVGAAGLIFAPSIIAIFRHDDPAVISIGSQNLRYQCLTILLLGWTTLNSMMMQTMGKTFRASLLAISRQGLFMIPLLFLLTPRLGLPGIQLAQPLADVATFVLSIPVFISVKRELREK